jgi:predicted nucleic acid-binding protein
VNAYVDASVVLRIVLGEPGRLSTWPLIEQAVSSELVRVECLRTIDRARVRLRLADHAVARHRSDVLTLLGRMVLVRIDGAILERAAEPFPTVLGSLDAIHLSSALLVRDQIEGMRLATHDAKLATAAMAMGFAVDGA